MPIFFVDEEILDYKLECVFCPIKGNQLYFYADIDAIIYKKAGMKELEREFMSTNPFQMTVPSLSSGVNLSKHMIHIIGADMIYALDFKKDIYNSYDRTLRLIKDKKFNSVVFPPIPFSYKRLGDMNSYRTGMTLFNYFNKLYDLSNTNFYFLIKKQTLMDHLNNYVSTYVSTSKLSRRHKPLVYPLKTDEELQEYLKTADLEIFQQYYHNGEFNLTIKNTILSDVCALIKDKFGNNDLDFCIKANLNKKSYIKLFEEDYIPSKYELAGICMALNYELLDTFDLFEKCNKSLNYENEADCAIIAAIATHKYDVFALNQQLFLKGLIQVGSYIHPSKFVTTKQTVSQK